MSAEQTSSDVRMRGFRDRATVDAAWAWVDSQVRPLGSEREPLTDAYDRVLAGCVESGIDVPAFDRSAMDGFALRAAETLGSGSYQPLEFEVVGVSLPGRCWEGTLSSGQAVRIMTGAPIPAGCDAVVPAEFAIEREGRVEITTAVPEGKHISRVGEDIRTGTTVLESGRRLRPQDLGLLASIGADAVDVVRRPKVRVLITGDELALPGTPREPHQIYEANSYLLRGLLARDGAQLESLQRLADETAAIRHALSEEGADVILVSGGSSVGSEDQAPVLVRELGELSIHGVAMRPSSPAGMGRVGDALVFLLPGNPVSCLCAYEFFAGRAIRQLGGRQADFPHRRIVRPLTRKLVSAIGRVDFCRVLVNKQGVEPIALSGASILSSTTRASGFVVAPAECEGFGAGENVEVLLFGPED